MIDDGDAFEKAKQLSFADARLQFPPMWVIYDHPLDFPNSVIVRRWYGAHVDNTWMVIAPTIPDARTAAVNEGASRCINRMPEDDPAIAEVWI